VGFARFFADRNLLLDQISAEDAESLGTTLEREWGQRQAVFIFLALSAFLLLVRCQLLSVQTGIFPGVPARSEPSAARLRAQPPLMPMWSPPVATSDEL